MTVVEFRGGDSCKGAAEGASGSDAGRQGGGLASGAQVACRREFSGKALSTKLAN